YLLINYIINYNKIILKTKDK
ncbi:hypothetical protein FPSE_12450, partial [Fusarium pseudograminearum CS3096]